MNRGRLIWMNFYAPCAPAHSIHYFFFPYHDHHYYYYHYFLVNFLSYLFEYLRWALFYPWSLSEDEVKSIFEILYTACSGQRVSITWHHIQFGRGITGLLLMIHKHLIVPTDKQYPLNRIFIYHFIIISLLIIRIIQMSIH